MEFKRPQKLLGPSQVSIVLGFSPFDTPDGLRDKLEHGYTRKVSTACQSGIRDEPRCRAHYIKTQGTPVRRCPFARDANCRFGGCGDGLIGDDGGLEIKCQYQKGPGQGPKVYHDYKVQAVAYMYLYGRIWWDIMVCSINNNYCDAVIERVYWKDYAETWRKDWYPKIRKFCESVNWS